MKNLKTTLTILSIVIWSSSIGQIEFTRDKQLHTLVGAGVGAGLTQLMTSSDLGYDRIDVILAPLLPVTFIALGKEMYDQSIKGTRASGPDILYTMIGGLCGSFITYTVNDMIQNNKIKKKAKTLKL